ncbi:caspase family protein [Dactylosporangium sp. NPDC049742]|uniref:caspase family protein n=1 Tax=Dactylosporangium sp. NPDC049742 TaxID=3154737 RepID=UPI00343A710B
MSGSSANAEGRRQRRALLLACSKYADPGLSALRSPSADIEALARTLSDPEGSKYHVESHVDVTSYEAQVAIDKFFGSANTRDLHLIYFSGHGVLDMRGHLHFAFSNTQRQVLSSTSLSAEWLRDRMTSSRSRSTVVLLDCCFSGAFPHGMRARSGEEANVASLVPDVAEGNGIAILTASGRTEYSLEEIDDESGLPPRPSYFTEAVVAGIESGDADSDRNGKITVDELYEYVYQRVASGPSTQRPNKLGFGEGRVVVADVKQTVRTSSRTPSRDELHAAGADSETDTRSPSSPNHPPLSGESPHPAQLTPRDVTKVRGLLGKLAFDGEWVTVTKEGIGPRMKGSVRIPVQHIDEIIIRPATGLIHGFIQFTLVGNTEHGVLGKRENPRRPGPEHPYSMSFKRSSNAEIAKIHRLINRARGVPEPALDPERNVRSPRNDAGSILPSSTSTPTEFRPIQADDAQSGRDDGALIAKILPLYALRGIIEAEFNLFQWITPWRQEWDLIARGLKPPTDHLTQWFPKVARCLGSLAVAPHFPEGRLIPTPTYVAGFTEGVRRSWLSAVQAGLLPGIPSVLFAWLEEPVPHGSKPRALLTLNDLSRIARRQKSIVALMHTRQIALWILVALFTFGEVVSLSITFTGGWKDSAANTIIGNLMCSIPLAAFIAAAVLDFRRSKRIRQRGTETPQHGPPAVPR